MKKLLALLLVFAMMVTMLVACGGKNNGDPQDTQGSNKPSTKPKGEDDEEETPIILADISFEKKT